VTDNLLTRTEAEALFDLLFYAGRTADEADATLYARIADKLDEMLVERGYADEAEADEASEAEA
jgi:hypothetical protein